MTTSSTRPAEAAAPAHTPPSPDYPGSGARVGRRLRPVVIAAVTAAIVLTGTANRPKPPPMLPSSHAAIALTSADSIDVGQGISITPAPGWTPGDRGPNWVALNNADSSAQMQVAIKPAGGTNVVEVLQGEINQLTGTPSSGLVNVNSLSAPIVKTLPGANFQRKASIDYTADVSTPQGTIPVIGTFSELLNTSNKLSAFIDFRQNNNATPQAASDGGMMMDSML